MIMEYHQRLTNRVHPVITEAGDNIVSRYSFVNEIINPWFNRSVLTSVENDLDYPA